eukprot:2076402-Rhodomonas_salina.1
MKVVGSTAPADAGAGGGAAAAADVPAGPVSARGSGLFTVGCRKGKTDTGRCEGDLQERRAEGAVW